mmetsp:Transcript_31204/g.92657  ORF Transcript_31204/g.92657 Transcript_31204/m.92657 type:complete len:264 (-) Transcript_31204:369-1160(-)
MDEALPDRLLSKLRRDLHLLEDGVHDRHVGLQPVRRGKQRAPSHHRDLRRPEDGVVVHEGAVDVGDRARPRVVLRVRVCVLTADVHHRLLPLGELPRPDVDLLAHVQVDQHRSRDHVPVLAEHGDVGAHDSLVPLHHIVHSVAVSVRVPVRGQHHALDHDVGLREGDSQRHEAGVLRVDAALAEVLVLREDPVVGLVCRSLLAVPGVLVVVVLVALVAQALVHGLLPHLGGPEGGLGLPHGRRQGLLGGHGLLRVQDGLGARD